MKGFAARLAAALAALWLAAFATPASAQTHEWYLKVGSWNLLNFGIWKATNDDGTDRAALLTRMGQIAAAYDIVVFQEVLQDGASVTQHLVNYMPGYVCNRMSAASGRTGRQERYAICAKLQTQWGTVAISALTDYSTAAQNFLAADNSLQAAQQVWMRPPVVARVTFTPTDATFQAFVFDIYTIHTKPAYGKTIPRGLKLPATNNSSVHFELQAVERNLANAPASGNQMLIGDLNADCTFYRPVFHGTDFAAWSWYVEPGERTTTALLSSCGYDKIVLNPAILGYRRLSGVDYPPYGNATRINDRRISDHYPVWVEFYQQRQDQPRPKRALTSASSLPVNQSNKQAKYNTTDTANIAGTSLPASQPNGQLNVVGMTDAALSFKSNLRFRLTDVRGQPSPAPTDANGDFTPVTWRNPIAGAFAFVFDANGDGFYDRADGDFANEDSQADIYVTAGSEGHNDLVTLGDNMVSRDIFNLDLARNVYAVGKNLPVSFTGNAYILSWKLLRAAGYQNWAAARAARIDLATYAIPIQREGVIQTSTLTAADRRQPFSTNPRGEMFMSVWSKPARLMNATVNYVPPPDSVFSPSQAGDGDPPESPRETDYIEDVCAAAYKWGADPNLRKACNSGFGFSAYYGNAFSVVLDVDNDGILATADKVDARDIGHMTDYFNGPGASALGPNANGNPAVSEYKEYLSRALSVDLSADNIFDSATQNASARYACGTALSKAAFQTWIIDDSQTGFRVLEQSGYQAERTQRSGIRQYIDEYVDEEDYIDSEVCINADAVTFAGPINLSQGSNVTSVAQTQTFENATVTVTDSTFCVGAVSTTDGAALAFRPGAKVVTGGTGIVVGTVSPGPAGAIDVLGRLGCGILSPAN